MFRHCLFVHRHFIRYFVVAGFFFLNACLGRAAQTPAANAGSSAGQNTAQAPATVTPAAADSANSTINPPPVKSKKVWTNEEVSGMSSTISVVGDGRNGKAKGAVQGPPDAQYINTVRKQLEKLRGQIAQTDKELAVLKDFASGEPVSTSDREFHKNYGNQPIAQQIESLQTKKKDLQAQIDGLLDEARKKGVEPGQLR